MGALDFITFKIQPTLRCKKNHIFGEIRGIYFSGRKYVRGVGALVLSGWGWGGHFIMNGP